MSDQVKQSWWFEVDCPKKGSEFILLSVVASGMLPHQVIEAVKKHVRQYVKDGRPCDHCHRRHRPRNLKRGK